MPRTRLPRLSRMKGICRKAVISAPWAYWARISSARGPNTWSVKTLGTTIMSRSSVRGTVSTPSSMMGWKAMTRSTRPWASSSSSSEELPSNMENSTMGNWGRISGSTAKPQV